MADLKSELQQKIDSTNLAEDMEETKLHSIGMEVKKWFDEDVESRRQWLDRSNEWLKLATQVTEKKSYPWPDAANVKYPLMTTAAMQFAARAYPALIPGPRLVQGLVIGKDEQGMKQQSAERVGAHMSYQVLYEMDGWEEDMDRLCMILPIVGVIFKKTWFDPVQKKNVSDLILPQDFVVDYFAKTLDSAARKSHIKYFNKNEIRERVNRGIYRDAKLPDPMSVAEERRAKDIIDGQTEPQLTPASPYKIVEMHCWWDFDEDEYAEPYVVTFEYDSGEILRIVPRFTIEDVEFDPNDEDKIVCIKATEYFTKFGFIPNPDGSIYDLGFGILLGGLNETVNTLTNQLLDSGSLNNLQSGFLGRGIRVRSGNTKFLPGEWKPVDFTGDDIKKHIFPLPTKEPSEVLFKLLETLVTSGKELASVAEIMVGKMPGQNTPATTTMATIEQGLKVFTAIYKRIYRSLGKEYEKLFKLNAINLPDETLYFTINEPEGAQSQEVAKQDYAMGVAVKPNADPNIVSSAQKLMRVQAIGPLLQMRTINPVEYTRRYLEAIDEENISTLLVTNPGPDPEAQAQQQEMQMKQQESQMKMQIEQMKAAIKQQQMQMEMQFKQFELQLKGKEAQMDLQIAQQKGNQEMQIAQQQGAVEMQQAQMDMTMSQEEHEMGMEQAKQQHSQSLEQGEAAHKQKLQQTKEAAKAKPAKK